jgi:hypothetical protein
MELVVAVMIILMVLSLAGLAIIGVCLLWWGEKMPVKKINQFLWLIGGLFIFALANMAGVVWVMQH